MTPYIPHGENRGSLQIYPNSSWMWRTFCKFDVFCYEKCVKKSYVGYKSVRKL
jgi:hypothetical protein